MGAMSKALVIVPCFNEERRLRADEVLRLISAEKVDVLLVDDGSIDGTASLLREISAQAPARVRALILERHDGKAEAVRRGLQQGLASGYEIVGFLDADFSPLALEWLRLLGVLRATGMRVVLGSRVRRAGAQVERLAVRHVVGRIFATAVSITLEHPFYDTQCGAKVFLDTPALRRALATPFQSRWVFDVELLSRLLNGPDALAFGDFVEVPLLRWRDVGGSKLRLRSMLRAGIDLARFKVDRNKRRRGSTRAVAA
ncbi:MAG: glycosyltransferase [Deltaproteobacteria bacterium]|nr:glycosyltransferase [Deltaproteobacteria bacterium]